jgi:tetratricopeptide (TPR) repeat protein
MDDIEQIENNEVGHSLKNTAIFFHGGSFPSGSPDRLIGNFYRPITLVANATIYTIFGPNATAFHFIQLVLHIVVACLLVVLFLPFFGLRIAAILSLIFLSHPINTETTAYISDLQDVLFVLFGLISTLISREAFDGKIMRPLIFITTLLSSLLAKESGILFIPVIFLGSRLFGSTRKFRRVLLLCGIVVAIYASIRFTSGTLFIHSNPESPIMSANLAERLQTIPKIFTTYTSALITGGYLPVAQHWTVKTINSPDFYIPLLCVMIFFSVAVFFAIKIKKQAINMVPFLYFSTWFILGIGIHLQFIPLDQTVADRWFYFPFIGILGIVGILIKNLTNAKPARYQSHVVVLIAVVLLAGLSYKSFTRSLDWKNSLTILRHDEKLNSTSFSLESALGNELTKVGQFEAAEMHLNKSIKLYATHSNWHNLGVVKSRRGDYSGSIAAYKSALMYGDFYRTRENMIGNLLLLGQNTEASSLSQEALRLYPMDYRLWLFWSIAEYNLGNKSAAIIGLANTYKLNPSSDILNIRDKVINNQPLILAN